MELAIAITTSAIAAVAAVLAAWLSATAKATQERNADEVKRYRTERERIDRAKWKVLLATMEGVTVLLKSAKGEQLNGNVEEALEDIQEANDELHEIQVEALLDKQGV